MQIHTYPCTHTQTHTRQKAGARDLKHVPMGKNSQLYLKAVASRNKHLKSPKHAELLKQCLFDETCLKCTTSKRAAGGGWGDARKYAVGDV